MYFTIFQGCVMTIQEMRERKIELGFSNEALAELSGVPAATIQKIFSGSTRAPRKATLDKLTAILQPDSPAPKKQYSYLESRKTPEPAVLKERSGKYGSPLISGNTALTAGKTNGEYTLEDYLALPDDQRVELIDGFFYDMAAPTSVHQIIGGYIHKALLDHVLANKGKCIPMISPVDVQLDSDNRTVVQPDVLIVCDRSKFQNGRIFGAPDFLVEVLSPSTRKKDMFLKLFKYHNAGVREYWLVDPAAKEITVYDLEHENRPVIYTFDDEVPVLIWGGACKVNFAEIYEFVSFLY